MIEYVSKVEIRSVLMLKKKQKSTKEVDAQWAIHFWRQNSNIGKIFINVDVDDFSMILSRLLKLFFRDYVSNLPVCIIVLDCITLSIPSFPISL